MKARLRVVLDRAIEEGIAYGLNRAYKHTEKPTREQIAEQLDIAIWGSIDEVVSFEDEPEG